VENDFVAAVMAGLPRSNLKLRPPAHNPNHRIATPSLIDVKNASRDFL
jgi:hypothetical protein